MKCDPGARCRRCACLCARFYAIMRKFTAPKSTSFISKISARTHTHDNRRWSSSRYVDDNFQHLHLNGAANTPTPAICVPAMRCHFITLHIPMHRTIMSGAVSLRRFSLPSRFVGVFFPVFVLRSLLALMLCHSVPYKWKYQNVTFSAYIKPSQSCENPRK